MLTSLYYSFTKITILGLGRRKPEFIGIDNFVRALTDDEVFMQSIGNTFFYSIVRVLLGLFVALLIALLLDRKILGKKVFRTLVYIPAIVPIVANAFLWKQLFSQDFSLFNYFIVNLGMAPVEWLNYDNAMWSVILMSIWSGIGPSMLILLAALQGVPKDLVEASEIDGANALHKFRYIVVPMISSTLLYLVVTGFIGTLQAFAEMDLLTAGGPGTSTTTMAMNVIQNAFSSDGSGMGYASAQAWIIFVIILIFTIIFFKIISKHIYYAGGDE